MNSNSRSRRCAIFDMSPVRKLSIPTTEWPRLSSASHRCDPMNPAAPVTTDLRMYQIPNPKSQNPNPNPRLDIVRCFMFSSCDSGFGVWDVGLSIGSSSKQPAYDGQPHDLQIEGDRPVLDVIEIEFNPLLERGVAAPAVDLRPPGDAGLD